MKQQKGISQTVYFPPDVMRLIEKNKGAYSTSAIITKLVRDKWGQREEKRK